MCRVHDHKSNQLPWMMKKNDKFYINFLLYQHHKNLKIYNFVKFDMSFKQAIPKL